MRILLAMALSSFLAYQLNRLLFARLGTLGIITLVPVAEELLKTGLSIFLGATLWWVHLGFGLLEAALDVAQRPRPFPEVGFLAAFCSIVGHAAFGSVTVWGWESTGQVFWGFALGIGLHLLWNVWIVRIAANNREGLS